VSGGLGGNVAGVYGKATDSGGEAQHFSKHSDSGGVCGIDSEKDGLAEMAAFGIDAYDMLKAPRSAPLYTSPAGLTPNSTLGKIVEYELWKGLE